MVAHAVLGHHISGDGRRALDVVGGAGRHRLEFQLLRGAAAEEAHDHVVQFRLGVEVFFLFRDLHDVAERAHSAGHDRDLLHGFGVLLHGADEGVAHLVVGDDPPLLLVHDAVLLFLADQDLLDGFEEVLLGHVFAPVLDGVDRRLVDHVGQVAADRAARRERDLLQVHALVHLHVAGVHLQDRDAALEVRPLHDDPPVEAARSQERLVEDLRAVGRADDQDALGRLKAVHLGEQLVQGLLPLLVAAVARIAAAPDRVDLVDEDDAGGVLVRFPEQVAHTGGADAHVEFNEIRSRQREERHMRLAGHRLGE